MGVPVPDKFAFKNPEKLHRIIEDAVLEAKEKGISGKNITPFLLAKVKELTGGESLKTNIELVKNNARIGSQIAYELSKLKNDEAQFNKRGKTIKAYYDKKIPVIIGGSNLDIISKPTNNSSFNNSTPGLIRESAGGYKKIIAELEEILLKLVIEPVEVRFSLQQSEMIMLEI